MSKRIGLITLFSVWIIWGQAQETFSYPEADQQSYALFQQQKWKELIDFSEQIRKQGIDFFYLQVRTGIAWYNLKKYRKASRWFLKAWENDQTFEWLQEYLYYSLSFGGRKAEASKIAEEFSVAVKEKINFESMKPLYAAFEVGYAFNPDADQLINNHFDEQLNIDQDYGEAFFFKNYHFESLDYSHQLGPGFGLNHNITHIGISRDEQIFWGERNLFSINAKQFNYYISPWFVLGKKWYISPSMNVIWGNSDLVLGNYDPNTFYSSRSKFSDFTISGSTWSHFGNFSPGAEINLANISDKKFSQFSGWVTWYPLSNLSLYITPRVYFKNSNTNPFSFNTFGLSGGAQLGPVHVYGQYLQGDMENFIEASGYIIANFPGTSGQKFTGSLYIPAGKNIQFVVRYITQDITETYRVYTNGEISNSLDYNYLKHTLTAGISWNF